MRSRVAIGAVLVVAVATAAAAQTEDTKTLNLEGAQRVLAAAIAEAQRLRAPGGAIAIVDRGGDLLTLARLDGTFAAAERVARGKAYTAAQFQRPTKLFEDLIVERGRTSMVALDDFTPLQGGVPIVKDGQVLGAIGVSGAASAAQDQEIAAAAAASVEGWGNSEGVSHVSAAEVSAAFAAGKPILEVDTFKIHASRRDLPGRSEVHALDTDIFYILDGSATFVTDGELVDEETTAPHETRGSGIRGGVERKLEEGDLIVIPRGTPHWFREVSPPFLYYTVKVTALGSAG